MYTLDQAFKESTEYFNGDELAASVFVDKYALKDNDGNLLELTPTDMHKRLAKEFARIEKNKFKKPLTEDEIFKLFDRFSSIVPQGSPMAGIGNPYSYQTLGNCYVLDNVVDSYGGIFHADQLLGQLMKRRAGVGMDISNIRPKGLNVKNSAKTTDGITIFMERFSNTCREVAQDGRRGALLLSINVHHPEVSSFINIKKDRKKVTGANVSVRLTDSFLKAVENDEEYEQYWPLDGSEKQISRLVKAKDVWNQIIECAWDSGEPGVMFWDTMINNSISNRYGKINPAFYDKTTNPCGEINMGTDSCRLMIVPLHNFVEKPFTKEAYFNFDRFGKIVEIAQRLMDDLIDLELECIDKIMKKVNSDKESVEIKQIEINLWKQIKEVCEQGRRTGLGINALADTIASLNVKYGSDESIKLTESFFKHFAIHSLKSSCLLAKELGPFPIYNNQLENEMPNPFLQRIFQLSPEVKELHEKYGRRNISLTTCSPTGTVSILTQTSSGIEPVFNLNFTRRKKINSENKNAKIDFVDESGDKWEEFTVLHPYLKKWTEVTGLTDITKSPFFNATVDKIDLNKSIEIQAIAQLYITHSLSKTANAPKSITKEEVNKLYLTAWKFGCKGFTFYRDGSRSGVLVNKTDKDCDCEKRDAPKRPKELECDIYHVNIVKKLDKLRTFKYMVIVGLLEGKPYEIFSIENGHFDKKLTKGKIIKHNRGNYELVFNDPNVPPLKNITEETTENEDALTRSVSLSLRHKIPVNFIVTQLNKVEGELLNFSKSLARSLKKYIIDGTKTNEDCPECGSKLVFEAGCNICKLCGYGKCS